MTRRRLLCGLIGVAAWFVAHWYAVAFFAGGVTALEYVRILELWALRSFRRRSRSKPA